MLVDFGTVVRTFRYSRSDFSALAATISVTLFFGVEPGVISGVALSIALHLFRSSRPHMAIVGLVPGSEHFRNVDRHNVLTGDRVLTIRVDESLFFANAQYLETRIFERVARDKGIRHFVLMCSAVNEIDFSALVAADLPNGWKSGQSLQFQGASAFHLEKDKIISIIDQS